MFWILLGGLGGLAVVSVAAWARSSRKRVEAAEKLRRENQRLKIEEQTLLARRKPRAEEGG